MPGSFIERQEVVGIFHAKRVILRSSVYSLTIAREKSSNRDFSGFWERGSPDLPACGPRRGSASGPVRPIFANKHSRPSRGAKPREADDTRPPREWPSQAGSRGAEISRRGKTSRGSCDVNHDDRHQVGASERSVLVSSLVLRRPARARSTEASGKGCYIGATRPRPGGRQGGGHRGAQDGVTTRAFRRRRPLLSG